MEDFQEQDRLNIQHNTLYCIKNYCINNFPYESGGIVNIDHTVFFYKTLIKDMLNYRPEPSFYLHITKPETIKFCFHSHLHSPEPSDNDIFFIKNYDIPLIIYSLKLNSFLSVNIKNEKIITSWIFEKGGLWEFNAESRQS